MCGCFDSRPDRHDVDVQAYGDAGLERWVDRSAELAEAFARKVEGSQGAFQLVMKEAPFNTCFWWVPCQLRPYRPNQASAADKALLSKVGLSPTTHKGTDLQALSEHRLHSEKWLHRIHLTALSSAVADPDCDI